MSDNVLTAIDFQMKVLQMTKEDETLRFENRFLLQGYLNCARDAGVITDEKFKEFRDQADKIFNLGEFLMKRLNENFKEVLGVDLAKLLSSEGGL